MVIPFTMSYLCGAGLSAMAVIKPNIDNEETLR